MLSFEQLTFNINQKTVFSNISMTFLPSSVIYLTGPNGCGKTSLLRMIANIQNPSTGDIVYRFTDCGNLKKPYCNYIGHDNALKPQITVLENLRFWSGVYNSLETLESSIYYFRLHDILYEKCYKLSAGNLKKVTLAKLIACQSDLWLLDEVEANLDDENKYLLNNLIISKANSGGIIFITSHSGVDIQTAQILNLANYTTG